VRSLGEPDLVSLRDRVDTAWSIWQGSQHRYTEASDVLPGLITDVQAVQRTLGPTAPEQERREAQRIRRPPGQPDRPPALYHE
jgi:hypothetical protein